MSDSPTVAQHQAAEPAALARRLTSLGYIGLFQQAEDEAVRSLWREPGLPHALAALALDPHAAALPRFLAAEIMFAMQKTFPHQKDASALAELYATALQENVTEAANTWGMPGISQGLVGEHAVALGAAVGPAFAPLLDDATPVQYEGSEESTIGRIYGYRIKDLAAALIAEVKHIPFEGEKSPGKRDTTIATLKQALR